ncbi:MAG: twin-arginine translocase TatA/TatE family subunit [Polyangiaceae bacterium]|mgnify:CR=1 FL=1|nr:twin-arginine translocase TatA/TatE family subunit [Polyangiaceae bacterium]
MFGLSFGELILIVVVAVVAIGPKELPSVLRKLGQYAAKARRAITDLRVQSGIDDVLHHEGISEPLREIRKLARGELDHVVAHARPAVVALGAEAGAQTEIVEEEYVDILHMREHEYPRDTADNYGALPEGSTVGQELGVVASPLASNALYMEGKLDP